MLGKNVKIYAWMLSDGIPFNANKEINNGRILFDGDSLLVTLNWMETLMILQIYIVYPIMI